jgi:hypothetical protein
MKVKADSVGDTEYLTAGKEYEVIGESYGGSLCVIMCDEGDRLDIDLDCCAHIDGGCWTVVKD